MRGGLQWIVVPACLFGLAGPVAARPPPALRVAVVLEEGVRADVEPIESFLREADGLRVVGPVDRAVPRDANRIRALGRSLDVAIVVVVSRGDEGTVLRVFEVRRGAYFEGVLPAPHRRDSVRAFVSERAQTTRRATEPVSEEDEGGSNLRTWAGLGVAVLAVGIFAALIVFGGSDDAPENVRVDVTR